MYSYYFGHTMIIPCFGDINHFSEQILVIQQFAMGNHHFYPLAKTSNFLWAMTSNGFQWLPMASNRASQEGPKPKQSEKVRHRGNRGAARNSGGCLFLSQIDREILLGRINTKIYQNHNPLMIFFYLENRYRDMLLFRDIRIYCFGRFPDQIFRRTECCFDLQVDKTGSRKPIGPRCGAQHPNFLFLKGHISPMYTCI